MKLTEKQKRFADYYIELGDQAEAYTRAGYKVSNKQSARAAASRMLTNVNVSAYISEKMAEKDAERIAKQDEILGFLTKVMRDEVTEQIPLGSGTGEQTLAKKNVYIKDRVKAAELLGKRHNMWSENMNIQANVGVVIIDDIGADD